MKFAPVLSKSTVPAPLRRCYFTPPPPPPPIFAG